MGKNSKKLESVMSKRAQGYESQSGILNNNNNKKKVEFCLGIHKLIHAKRKNVHRSI